VPETIRFAGLHIGRFEVTGAQFAEFDPTASAEGRENEPVIGVTFDQTRAYCAWLSEVTGQRWRLPNAADAESLYANVRDGENILDYWAGYAPNPEDARALVAQAHAFGPHALLRPVGSFGCEPESGAFDLGGNAAEWVELDTGRGAVWGGSADQPAKALQRGRNPHSTCVGFRVVREAADRR
jgi:formylglycine-generating enzyme required for sulfatase activity